MDLDDLHLAVVIAREGSLSAASAQLGIGVATLSKAVARLERATKVRLFDRLARGMRPTELGQAFLQRAQRIDLDAADLMAALRDLRQGRAGTLRVGLGLGVPDPWVQAFALPLLRQGVQLEISGGMTDAMQRGVRQGTLEFAVLGLKGSPGPELSWRPLLPDPLQPVALASHPLAAAGRSASWAELQAAAWVMTAPGTATHAEFEANFRARGRAPPRPAVLSRSSHRERLLAEALGALLLLPLALVRHGSPTIGGGPRWRALTVEGGWRSDRHLGILHRADAYLSPAAGQAIALLEAAAGVDNDATLVAAPAADAAGAAPSRRRHRRAPAAA